MGVSTPVLFLAFANDRDAHLALLKAESREVYQTLQELDQKEYIRIHREESAEIDEIFETLMTFKDRVAVFHFAGHAGGSHLQLESGAAHARGLAQLLGEQPNLKLVFLNGCSTRQQVETLMKTGVKAVIATSVSILDRKAQEFAVRFYKALATGRTIDQAFKLAASLAAEHGDGRDIGIVTYRDLTPAEPVGQDSTELPWGLYISDEHKEEILRWQLPSDRPIGLPPITLPNGSPLRRVLFVLLVVIAVVVLVVILYWLQPILQ